MLLFCSASLAYSKGIGTAALVVGATSAVALPFSYWYLRRYGYVSQRGNRKLNHALHLAAICQIRNPGTEGRTYFERKIAEGKTKKDAIRSLKRHVSNAVYRKLLEDHRNREM